MKLTQSQVIDLYPRDIDGTRHCAHCGEEVAPAVALLNGHSDSCYPNLRPVVREELAGTERIREYEDGTASRKCLACSTSDVYDSWVEATEAPTCPC